MKELLVLFMAILMFIGVVRIGKLEDQTKLTKEQIEILTIYCMAMPECREEMEK